ncbi:MAG: hypothetical protein ACI9U2_004886 [Bradymonadia bacterium]|jgi:hypothetical protein
MKPRIMNTLTVKWLTDHPLRTFRIALGLYLSVVLARLLPWAADLYSNQGVLADFRMNPTHGYVFDLLYIWDSPLAVTLFVGGLLIAALCLAAGALPRIMAVVLWAGWAMLWHRNVFTLNPALPFIGFLLLAVPFMPRGLNRGAMPRDVWRVLWIVMAVGYTWSGVTKLMSPSWVNGEALSLILSGPLARDAPWVAWIADAAWTPLLTWSTVALELAFVPLALWRKTRPWVWLAAVGLHVGILATIQFAELTIGMLVVHLATFDPAWWPAKAPAATEAGGLAAGTGVASI